jgi:hypothetical protein
MKKDFKNFYERAIENDYVGRHKELGFLVNLAGNYDYLEQPYYISQEYEYHNTEIHPSCKEMLDAYIPPIFLETARVAGLQVPEFYISNGYFEPPVIIDPINPFMIKSRIVNKTGREKAIAKSMTRNFTYAICCQEIPAGSKITKFRSVLGQSRKHLFEGISRQVWENFHIPLAIVRVIMTADDRILLSDISQLPFEKLNHQELSILEKHISWEK